MRERRGWEGDEEGVDDEEGGEDEDEEEDEEEGDGAFNLTISPCLRRGARLGKISPAARSPTACPELENKAGDIDVVGSLGGILYLTGDAREGLVCLEGKVVVIIITTTIIVMIIIITITTTTTTTMITIIIQHNHHHHHQGCSNPTGGGNQRYVPLTKSLVLRLWKQVRILPLALKIPPALKRE